MPNRGKRQARDKQRAGQALCLVVVPAFNEEQVFFAETVVFDADKVGMGVVGGKQPGAFYGVIVDIAV